MRFSGTNFCCFGVSGYSCSTKGRLFLTVLRSVRSIKMTRSKLTAMLKLQAEIMKGFVGSTYSSQSTPVATIWNAKFRLQNIWLLYQASDRLRLYSKIISAVLRNQARASRA